MTKGIILGIDLSRDYTQMAYLDGDGNPTCISMGTGDNYLIPTAVCYNKNVDEWSAGDEALNKSKLEGSTFYGDILEVLEKNEDSEVVANVYDAFVRFILKAAINFCNGRVIKNILISAEDVTPELVDIITSTFDNLGYENVKVMSHSESFAYYVLNMNKEIWINKVSFLNFTRDGLKFRCMETVKGRQFNVVSVTAKDLSGATNLDEVENNPKLADEKIAIYMNEYLNHNIVSGAFLCGEGFYKGSWEKTLTTLCQNRRVFKGSNLLVKGAAFAAREIFYTPHLENYLISCKGRTRVKVTMEVKHKERDSQIVLSNIGDYWYQAGNTIECIMDKKTEAVFEIHDIMNRRSEKFSIDLKEFPDRPAKTTRLSIDFRYVDEDKFQIEIKDLGFGEFFPASEIKAVYTKTLD